MPDTIQRDGTEPIALLFNVWDMCGIVWVNLEQPFSLHPATSCSL